MHPSPRVVAIPLFDPVYYDTGKRNGRNAILKFVNYLGFFVERMQGNDVVRPHHYRSADLRKGAGSALRRSRRSRAPFDSWSRRTMAQLAASIVSHDDEFKRQVATLLRACGVPVGIVEDRRTGAKPPVRTSSSSTSAPTPRRAWRRSSGCAPGIATVAIFAIAAAAEPDLILQAMRAGANEFFPWTRGTTQSSRAIEESFHGAVRRTAARREAATAGAKPPCVTHVFLGAKGGAGTTTVAVNCAVELARLTKRPTVDRRPEAVSRRSGAVPRRASAVHRARRDREPSSARQGLPARAGGASTSPDSTSSPASEQFDRPNRAGRRRHRRAASRPGTRLRLRRHRRRQRDQRVRRVAALYAADTIFLVTNPDVPSIRNAQRLVDRVRQLGAGSERIKILLNRVSDQNLIAPKQIETALGYGDPPHVLQRLPDGVDRAQLGRAAVAHEPFRARGAVRQLHPAASRRSTTRRRSSRSARSAVPRTSVTGNQSHVQCPSTSEQPPAAHLQRGRGPKRRGRSTSS